jgi:hypothetical protein
MKMTNRERLEEAGIVKKDLQLTPEQEQAIESLTDQEIDALISIRNKIADKLPPGELTIPITHHH